MNPKIDTENECRELVDKHVYGNFSQLVDYFSSHRQLLDVSEYSYDGDILPLLYKYEYLEEAQYNGFAGNSEDEAMEFCHKNNIEPYTIDALEHWLVSNWLAYNLKERGEIVGSLFGLNIWGRSTSGQVIYSDYIIEKIYAETTKKQIELSFQ